MQCFCFEQHEWEVNGTALGTGSVSSSVCMYGYRPLPPPEPADCAALHSGVAGQPTSRPRNCTRRRAQPSWVRRSSPFGDWSDSWWTRVDSKVETHCCWRLESRSSLVLGFWHSIIYRLIKHRKRSHRLRWFQLRCRYKLKFEHFFLF